VPKCSRPYQCSGSFQQPKVERHFFLNTKLSQATKWFTNPLTRGSYSYQTLASELESITPDDLAEPVNNILFAGEATHQEYFSCVHGAIESGFREARRIISMSK